MLDPLTPVERSRRMALVTSKNTQPERAVRKILRSLGYRYQIHSAGIPGTPDIVLASFRKAIFVHGCFWHRHRGCPRTRTPRTRLAFWKRKFQQNVDRDRTTLLRLKWDGWNTLVVWECVSEQPERLRLRLLRFLGGPA